MTRKEAQDRIAAAWGVRVCDRDKRESGWCRFNGCKFYLNLLKYKKAGFYFYSHEDVSVPAAKSKVRGPWLRSLIKQAFSEGEYIFPKNKSPTNPESVQEGHIADFYFDDFDWENLDDKAIGRIRKLYDRLMDFQNKYWPSDEELDSEIQNYNQRNLADVDRYLKERLRKTTNGSTAGVDDGTDKGKNMNETMNEKIQSLLEDNLNVILTGAPGTGKTFTAKEVAKEMVGAKVPENATEEEKHNATEAEKRIASVQFHPGYDYSDFVIGMKPVLLDENNKEVKAGEEVKGNVQVSYKWQPGIFKEFADKAKADPDPNHKYVFLIDEINRADLSRVFGELFSLLEEDYRYPTREKGITLPNGEELVIPKNLYILGTMNDIDRSVESMDFALRRRFAWFEVKAEDSMPIIDKKVSDAVAAKKLKDAMAELNFEIAGEEVEKRKPTLELRLGSEYQLGGAIFAKYEKYKKDAERAFDNLWNNHIANILSEYLRGRTNRVPLLKKLKEEVYDKKVKVDGTSVGSATDGNGEAKPSDKGSENTDKEA